MLAGEARAAPLPPAPVRHSRPQLLLEAHARFDAPLRRFFARRALPPEEIEDLTQEVYLRLARQASPAGAIANLRAFVFATAGNLLLDRFRRRAVRGGELSVEADEPPLEDERADPAAAVAAAQQLQAALRVLRGLKPATRQAFLRHRLLGWSHTVIAREMGVSVSMVEKHMIAAIAALRPLR